MLGEPVSDGFVEGGGVAGRGQGAGLGCEKHKGGAADECCVSLSVASLCQSYPRVASCCSLSRAYRFFWLVLQLYLFTRRFRSVVRSDPRKPTGVSQGSLTVTI